MDRLRPYGWKNPVWCFIRAESRDAQAGSLTVGDRGLKWRESGGRTLSLLDCYPRRTGGEPGSPHVRGAYVRLGLLPLPVG
ncbi:hypothetical protein GCM10010306_041200 [Streptomyces umbrinus]|nr:hypothetical protein GCM10010306_041200 [Streptomyces umbrinus]